MTTRRRWLLLDANVVITLYAEGIWERLTASCDVVVPCRPCVCTCGHGARAGGAAALEVLRAP